MDSFPTLIPIKHMLKVSEEELKTKLESDEDEIWSEAKAIKEIPDLECRIDLLRDIEYDEADEEKETFTAYLTLLNIAEDVRIVYNLVFCIKSAGFLKYHDAYYDEDLNGVFVCDSADLFDPEKKFIVDGELIVEMKGLIFLKKKQMLPTRCEHVLIRRLWEDKEERDFTIVVRDDNGCKTEIEVHKLVLALRSPVFHRMFKTDMIEKREGKVQIIDFDLDTVKSAIACCYDQDIFDKYREWQQLINLQKFADKYDIEDLKRKTEFQFVNVISLENICEITNVVIQLNAPKLQDFCFRFLLLSSKDGIPIKDIDNLDTVVAADLFRKSMSVDFC